MHALLARGCILGNQSITFSTRLAGALCAPDSIQDLWCFADEDFLKSIKRVAMGVHVTTASQRTLQRYLVGIFGDSL